MKYCPFCKRNVKDDEVVRLPERTESEQRELEEFCAQVPGSAKPEEPALKDYHMRSVIRGERRKGVVGGWRSNEVRCGPLVDLDAA